MSSCRRWTEAEEQVLRTYRGTMVDRVRLAKELNRTPSSIVGKLNELRVTVVKPRTQSFWMAEELEIIRECIGEMPVAGILKRVNQWRKKQQFMPRSAKSLASKIDRMGLSRQIYTDSCYTIPQIAEALNTPYFKVSDWLRDKDYARILAPRPLSDAKESWRVIDTKNLKRFFIKYPGVLDGLSPSFPWLLSVLTWKEGKANG